MWDLAYSRGPSIDGPAGRVRLGKASAAVELNLNLQAAAGDDFDRTVDGALCRITAHGKSLRRRRNAAQLFPWRCAVATG